MKKTLLSSVMSMIIMSLLFLNCNIANAAVVEGTIGSGNFTDWEGNVSVTQGLDFNNDGELEFAFQTSGFDVEYVNCILMWTYAENGNNVWSNGTFDSGSGWDEAHAITENTSIGANATWGGEGDCNLVSFMGEEIVPLNQEVYLGIRIKWGSSVHYGWAKVKLVGSLTTGIVANWLEIAYESTPNTPILAGEHSVGIEEINEPLFSIYPNPVENEIHINSKQVVNSASLYDLNGKLVLSVNQIIDNTINVAEVSAGIYFLNIVADNQKTTLKVVKK